MVLVVPSTSITVIHSYLEFGKVILSKRSQPKQHKRNTLLSFIVFLLLRPKLRSLIRSMEGLILARDASRSQSLGKLGISLILIPGTH
jgi:hypothetical protein